ncbi:gamma-glutamyltransferase family protein [Priestia taiwanensis]|uniref:Gamma-glutamyltranspeptidase n=1 Tax=Priestia taiwanensis TaxID=1347902 RepID=A0A917EU24_9BACI|nr:gamma-glutamyltransferase [Priestia taiwanensis]GGE83443.1 gamma-glutamyltranspeptidase [Priestia taiwanensis]
MKRWQWIIVLFFVWLVVGCNKINRDVPNQKDQPHSLMDKEGTVNYGVSASHPIAVQEGMKVLEEGGNAVDAAIAVAYTLGVVEPYGSGIGGGGSMVIVTKDGMSTFVDYRETASNEEDTLSGVPGLVRGMEFAHDTYGSLPMKRLIQPAITHAEQGFAVDQHLTTRFQLAKPRISSSGLSAFYKKGKAMEVGSILVQPALGKTLRKIQEEGPDGFYRGDIADAVKGISGIPLKDLKEYGIEERRPVIGTYKGYTVYTAPPPFSGVTLLQILQLLDSEETYKKKENEELYIEEFGKMVKVTYKDRALYGGDPNFMEVDIHQRLSKELLEKMQREVRVEEHREQEVVDVEEHESTTHFVVMDKDGTVVSVTNTLGNFFGSGEYVEGFFLNSQMTQFGTKPNNREVGKRSRTFTAPTVLVSEQEVIGIGSPGGNRIPQIIAQVLDKYTNEREDMQSIVDRERFVLEKNVVYTEFLLEKEKRRYLDKGGYDVIYKYSPMFYGGIQTLIRDKKSDDITGAGDKRRNGSWNAYKKGGE